MNDADTQKKKRTVKKSTETPKEETKTTGKSVRKSAEKSAGKETNTEKTAEKTTPEKSKKTSEDKSIDEKQSSDTKADSEDHKPVPKEFLADLNKVTEAFTLNPGLIEPVREVFEYHLVDPINRKTFPKIVNSMSMLLGSSATMVIMTATHINNPAFFEDLLIAIDGDEKARSTVWTLQHLTAIYGNRVQKAYSLSSGTIDEDWHSIDINTFKREGEQPYYQVCLDIAQYNGTELHLKMTPESAFQLINILSEEMANNVPADEIDPELVTKCRKTTEEYYKKFYPDTDADKNEEDPAGYA